jgi:hypothetical protein
VAGDVTDDPFITHRRLLFTVAYEMLGTAADAEDVVQETWLRWDGVDQQDVRDPRAYLVTIVTRQSLNRLRTLRRRREEYVGEWLPEPVLTTPDIADDIELAESLSDGSCLPSSRARCRACSRCPRRTWCWSPTAAVSQRRSVTRSPALAPWRGRWPGSPPSCGTPMPGSRG